MFDATVLNVFNSETEHAGEKKSVWSHDLSASTSNRMLQFFVVQT